MRVARNVKLHSLRSSDDLLRILQHDEDFLDVTLCCDGPEETKLEAHKAILASSSSVFKEILNANKPFQSNGILTVYLRGVAYEDLSLLLDFIYQGEVSVPKQSITTFISLAEDLKVSGLFKGNSKKEELDNDDFDDKSKIKPNMLRKGNADTLIPKKEVKYPFPSLDDYNNVEGMEQAEMFQQADGMDDTMMNDNKSEDEEDEDESEDFANDSKKPIKVESEYNVNRPMRLKGKLVQTCQGQIMPSNKGKKVLLVNNFRYTFKRIAKKQRAMAWRCYRKNPPTHCPAELRTDILNFNQSHHELNMYQIEEHNHEINRFESKDVDFKRFLKRISYKISTSPFLTPKEIYDDCLSHISDQDLPNIPSFKSIKETIRKKIENAQKKQNLKTFREPDFQENVGFFQENEVY